jgi:glycosyltransferase involved in cell wall biosynthesis
MMIAGGTEGRMTQGARPSVVVSHPGVQQSYETVVALQQAGMLESFIASVYLTHGQPERHAPWRWLLPAQRALASAGLRRRWHPAIDTRRVRTIPAPFLAMRAVATGLDAARLGRYRSVERLGDAWFDWMAARTLPEQRVTQVHAFEGAALHTLRAAKRAGLAAVLDVAAAHEYNLAITQSEARAAGARPLLRFGSTSRVREERSVADVIVTPSDYVSNCLIEHGVDARKIVKIPFGADPDVFTPAPDAPRDGRFVLLDVASINYRKGTRYLLQAWRELALPDAELVLAGAPDESGAGMLREYEGLYRHLGHVPWFSLPDLFRSASAFVLPSLAEGSALVTYMAMASGLPVIVTDDAGSVAADGCEGWVVPSRDVAALKAKILHLYEHRGEAAEMGAAGRRLIQQRYTWQHYHQRIAALHRAIHSGGDAAGATAEADIEGAR